MSFAEQVKQFQIDAMRMVLAVFQTSAQFIAEGIVDNTPVDTGFLRNSFIVSLQPLPPITSTIGSPTNPALANAAIAYAQLPDTIYMGFTASYAMRMEYGFEGADSLGRVYNQSGRFFVRNQVQRWPEYVTKAMRQAKASL